MPIESDFAPDRGLLTVRITERFDFSVHEQFRAAYEVPGIQPRQIVVDLSRTDYLDSSALGMLLILREFATSHSAPVELRSPRPAVSRILDIANFKTLFQIA